MMENQEFDKDKVLGRVKKMLAIANDKAATEHERDTAMKMVHNVLAKYNLTMAQAEAAGNKPEEKRGANVYNLREYAWMRPLSAAVGSLFFCYFFYMPREVKHATYCFVGKESNATTALEMSKYLIQSIDREGQARAAAAGQPGRSTYWRDFCKGAMHRICIRCNQLIEDAKRESQQAGTGTSLVLASVYQTEHKANELVVQEKFGGTRKTKSRLQAPKTQGYNEGHEYGSKVGLNNQLGSNKEKPLAIR